MKDEQTGIAIRFIRQFDADGDRERIRACKHAHGVVLGPLVMCRDCLETFPLPRGADLQSPDRDADTEDEPQPLKH